MAARRRVSALPLLEENGGRCPSMNSRARAPARRNDLRRTRESIGTSGGWPRTGFARSSTCGVSSNAANRITSGPNDQWSRETLSLAATFEIGRSCLACRHVSHKSSCCHARAVEPLRCQRQRPDAMRPWNCTVRLRASANYWRPRRTNCVAPGKFARRGLPKKARPISKSTCAGSSNTSDRQGPVTRRRGRRIVEGQSERIRFH